ncbi:LytTR family DNA-binding domain-containing protein [Paracrocinitomix mangrovi]|uniref:LytR/AlgR family response regulator transcription factor n=1 Tax=Paracrocinitomix mangrovi TaxID=2862509 RepID=UPI001C8DE76B|nr:LytTR family DNA-binding domain-containing protein [Paracrocinitomix mangrovi]UKN00580.1 LytTR family DNA-binding domain-containing protein [Paracrocinitomix mangrovi]
MSKFKAVIVDDEESARNILYSLLSKYCPDIEVVALCADLEQGVEAIEKNCPSLVFLDIEMPNYAGYEITSFFDKIGFEIIFVTAYDHYAVRAFEVSALDYLLKPVEIQRLKEAVDKFVLKEKSRDLAKNYKVLVDSLNKDSIQKIIIPINGGQKVLELNEVVAIEANESYSVIHTQDKQYLYSKNLKHFETLLELNDNFVRIHKSWIINCDFMEFYSKSKLTVMLSNGIEAKLSKYKKQQFEELIVS